MARKKRALRPAVKLSGLDWVWAVIREKRRFTLNDIKLETNVDTSSIRSYVTGLELAGYLQPVEGAGKDRYDLVRDIGIERPRVREDGSEVAETGQDKMWRLMKTQGEITWRDLALFPGVSEGASRSYVLTLARVGILTVTQTARPGRPGKHVLLPRHNTGLRAPQILRDKSVYDPNTGQTHKPQKISSATSLEKVRLAWGGSPADWILVLALACDSASQRKVAKRIGCSASTINLVLHRKYDQGDMGRVERTVRAVLMSGGPDGCLE
jgi:hypothetical protein